VEATFASAGRFNVKHTSLLRGSKIEIVDSKNGRTWTSDGHWYRIDFALTTVLVFSELSYPEDII
jgi:hypothetical protein